MTGAWNRKHGEWRPFRAFAKTTVSIRFRGGPWRDGRAEVDSLDPIKIIFDPPIRQVYAYIHQSDGVYLYSKDSSRELSADYDAAYQKWGNTSFQVTTG
jgi:hypothetical protein